MATPPPFVGRVKELSTLDRALNEYEVIVLQGAVGSGKTRLAHAVAARASIRQSAHVRCLPGDRGVALVARAERIMNLLPGTLRDALASDPWLLIVDDVHQLAEPDAARTLNAMIPAVARARGRLILITRDALPLRRGLARAEIMLEGLDEASARELWHHLEAIYGPTRQGACDRALGRTRGMPLAMRHEYACALVGPGDDAWELDSLEPAERAALEAISVLRMPVAPAAVAAMVPDVPVEAVLVELVTRQLIDPTDEGRFSVHDVVRDEVLQAMAPAQRSALERAAARLVLSVGRGTDDARRLAWDAGDDGALGQLAPVDRMREAVLHHVAADDMDEAVALLVAAGEHDMRGASGEILSLIDMLRSDMLHSGLPGSQDMPGNQIPGPAAHRRALDALQATLAVRQGCVARALELGTGGSDGIDRVEAARLCYRAGDIGTARRQLEELVQSGHPADRCRAACVLAEIELLRGQPRAAEALVTAAFERDRALVDDNVRARLHVALAAVYEYEGRISAARAALARASSSGRIDTSLGAYIEARRSVCLAHEGRLTEAEAVLDEAERMARDIDAGSVVEDVRHCRSLVSLRRGDTQAAIHILRELVADRRQRGDEMGALCAEIDLGRVLARLGELSQSAELVSACTASAARRKLDGLSAAVHLTGAMIDVSERRTSSAEIELDRVLADPAASAEVRLQAILLASVVKAWRGQPITRQELDDVATLMPELCDDIDMGRAHALMTLAGGDVEGAAQVARSVAVRAERAGRCVDLAEALALCGRLLFVQGDKAGAGAASARALVEARRSGQKSAQAHALLVLAALAREDGARTAAINHVRKAGEVATAAGLPIERLVSAEASDAIAGPDHEARDHDIRSAACATLSESALDAAARILSDLGLTCARPYRMVSAGGVESYVSDARSDSMRIEQRSLVIDSVREVVLRRGDVMVDLRRRTQVKRILFLFAGAPGHIFSKEEIVQRIWSVEYHPLRHDAALFTNIMRIRRLLGEDGADILRASDDGYRFVPPKDYLYVEAVGA